MVTPELRLITDCILYYIIILCRIVYCIYIFMGCNNTIEYVRKRRLTHGGPVIASCSLRINFAMVLVILDADFIAAL